MVELGKPIHTFDAGAVARDAQGRAGIEVRLARAGERVATLDHVDRALDAETLLIADASGPSGSPA
jgi:phenylalanyl-tRNA synthetase beta chain